MSFRFVVGLPNAPSPRILCERSQRTPRSLLVARSYGVFISRFSQQSTELTKTLASIRVKFSRNTMKITFASAAILPSGVRSIQARPRRQKILTAENIEGRKKPRVRERDKRPRVSAANISIISAEGFTEEPHRKSFLEKWIPRELVNGTLRTSDQECSPFAVFFLAFRTRPRIHFLQAFSSRTSGRFY